MANDPDAHGLRRRATLGAVFFGLLVAVSHVIVCSGGPEWPRQLALWGMAVCAFVCAFAGGSGWLDRWRLPMVLLFLTQVPALNSKLHAPDGFEYYVLARSPIFDHDLELGNDFKSLGGFGPAPGQRAKSRTPCGLAILWTPTILLVHAGVLVARTLGADVAADGSSAPYQAGVSIASFLFGIAALALTETLVRRRHGPPIGLLVSFALWAATPLAFYTVAAPTTSHTASALMVGVFIVLWLDYRDSTSTRDWLLLGFVGGLASIVRIQDGVLLAAPLLDQAYRRRPGWLSRSATMLVGPALAGTLQAAVWANLWGPDFVTKVAKANLFQGNFHVFEMLLSPRHGVFTWTPLWFVAALGLVLLLRRDLRLGAFALGALVLVVLVNAGMDDWSGDISFGQRRLLCMTLLFGLGLGEVFFLLAERPLVTVAAVVAGLALWTQQFTGIFAKRIVAGRDEPVTLDRLAPAQVDAFLKEWLEAEDRLPGWLFVAGYDNLKGVWLDEGRSLGGRIDLTVEDAQQPVAFLIGDGWLSPSESEGVWFRRSRGWSSSLRIPVYTPGHFELRARARSLLPGRVAATLRVNGVELGESSAGPEWGEMRYDIPRSALRSGLNDFVFAYETTRRGLDPSQRGLNAALAFQELVFKRLHP